MIPNAILESSIGNTDRAGKHLHNFYERADKYQYIVFHTVVFGLLLVLYLEILELDPASGSFPWIMLVVTAFMWAVIALDIFIPDNLKERLGVKLSERDELIDDEKRFEVHTPRSTKAFIWIIIYWVGITNVGFFVSVFAFTFVYGYINMDRKFSPRIAYSTIGSVLLTTIMYVFLIELVGAQYILRSGFLP